jgi:hypothetical protein
VRDQEYENAKEKRDILDTLRYQEKELDFLKQIANLILSEEEIEKIRKRVDFEEDEENLDVPDFYFVEEKNLNNLPTLPGDNKQIFNSRDSRTDTQRNFRVSTKRSQNIDYSRGNRDDVFDQFDNSSDYRGKQLHRKIFLTQI